MPADDLGSYRDPKLTVLLCLCTVQCGVWCRALWVVDHLGKVCWIGGGLLVLLGVILAVLTVELAADPDKWPGKSEAVLAAAGRMFRANSSPPDGTAADAGEGGTAGASSSRGGVAGGDAEQGLQEPLLQAPAGSGRPEIVEG